MSDNRCERRGLEDVKRILFGGEDDALFQRVVLQEVFREKEPFEVRKDIEIPNSENGNGAVISFDDGRIGYFNIFVQEFSGFFKPEMNCTLWTFNVFRICVFYKILLSKCSLINSLYVVVVNFIV